MEKTLRMILDFREYIRKQEKEGFYVPKEVHDYSRYIFEKEYGR